MTPPAGSTIRLIGPPTETFLHVAWSRSMLVHVASVDEAAGLARVVIVSPRNGSRIAWSDVSADAFDRLRWEPAAPVLDTSPSATGAQPHWTEPGSIRGRKPGT